MEGHLKLRLHSLYVETRTIYWPGLSLSMVLARLELERGPPFIFILDQGPEIFSLTIGLGEFIEFVKTRFSWEFECGTILGKWNNGCKKRNTGKKVIWSKESGTAYIGSLNDLRNCNNKRSKWNGIKLERLKTSKESGTIKRKWINGKKKD